MKHPAMSLQMMGRTLADEQIETGVCHMWQEDVPERGDRMLHLEHPTRKYTAWCGAEVLGVREPSFLAEVDCVVCADLRRAWKKRRR